jgi:CubicO group peptidase (beta-lactamase class C family)
MDLVQGTCPERFGQLQKLLLQFIESGEELGASITVNIGGQDVVDIWGGYFDEGRTQRWERDTITNVFSTTKTVTALARLMLVDRGLLNFDAKVSQYWPEFRQGGKEDIEVRHVFTHNTGIPGWEQQISLEDVCDFQKSTKMLASQAPWWKSGTASGYQSFTMGHLVGELVFRVTGKTLKQFVTDEIAAPLNADFQIGIADMDLHRVSDVIPPPAPPPADNVPVQQKSVQHKDFTNPEFHASFANSRLWREADLGGSNGHGNARSIARILSAISQGGRVDNHLVLSPSIIDTVMTEQSMGQDMVIGAPIRFGMGFGLTGKDTFVDWLPTGRICFWGGFGGSIIIMDLDRCLTICYVMNKLDNVGLGSKRTKAYVKAIYQVFGISLDC